MSVKKICESIIFTIWQVIEFNGKTCFQQFVDNVTAARRMGDETDGLEIISNMAKLTGKIK